MTTGISVIIPVFNMASTVGKAVRSTLAQDYHNLEIIIVNDGSTDNTREVVESLFEEFRSSGANIRCINRENAGKPAAVNGAIKEAAGEYIALLDADDTLPEGSLAARAAYLDGHPEAHAVFGDSNYFDESGTLFHVKKPSGDSSEKTMARAFIASVRAPFHPMALMYRKTAFDRAGFFDPGFRRSEDTEFCYRLFSKCTVGYLPLPVYNYIAVTLSPGRRLKNRVEIFYHKAIMIERHTSGLRRIFLHVNNLLKESVKFIFEIFTARRS